MSVSSSKKPTIVVAMSGGIDSSVAACELKTQGYNVIGITLQLFNYTDTKSNYKTCCAGQDIYDAKMVAEKFSIPHYIMDYQSKFQEKVIDDFVDSYIQGETPLPCVRCNQSVKFDDLLKFTKELGAEYLATGHYVRSKEYQGKNILLKGLDPTKDQSYFLFTTTQEQLNYLKFPIGNYTKKHTRELALEKYGLHIADKPDSQDICFVPDGDYAKIVLSRRPDAIKKGKIIHIDGYELGTHHGIINYTIGQRKRIGVSFNTPLYVIKIDSKNNVLYVGGDEHLSSQYIVLKDCNWLGDINIDDEVDIKVRIRSIQGEVKAKLTSLHDNRIKVEFLELQKATSPGQACVFYKQDRVMGGGWIIKDELN